jgi:enoyl-CoA hydratase/carnithine racemase
MMSSLLEQARSGHVLHITLNRPEKRNALNAQLCKELANAIEAADADQAVHAILLTGAGKSFCAGMDLAEIAAPPDVAEIDSLHERLFTLGSRVTTPIVMGVHGASLAGGTGLAANSHVLVADTAATFGLTEIRLGLWPFLVFRACAAAMGERRAMELSLTGRIFDAKEAQSLGLVHEVTTDVAARALETAEQIACVSRLAIRKGMATVHQSRGKSWGEGGELARKARKEVFESAEFRQGLRMWVKRKP